MKNSNLVSTTVLMANGLLFLVLGARIWSAPDVFANEQGFVALAQNVIDKLATLHGASFLLLGATAVVATVTPALVRWISVLLLTLAGIAAYASVWTLSGGYLTALLVALVVNVLALATAFLGEPLFTSPSMNAARDGEHLRWG